MSEKPEKLRIEYMDLEDIQPATRNPKRHEVEEIKQSIRRFGFVDVPAINETTGRMVKGHGRKEALVELQTAGEDAPRRILVKGGKWMVPVLRGVAFDTDEEAEAYLLADNRLSDIGGYDEAELARVLADIAKTAQGLAGTGYTNEQLDSMLRLSSGQDSVAGDIDPVAEWQGMPGFEHSDLNGFQKIIIHFKDAEAVADFAVKNGYRITESTRSLWYPDQPPEASAHKEYTGESVQDEP